MRRNLKQAAAQTIEIADAALDRIVAKKTFDFVEDFSSQITVGLLFRTMGLPPRDHNEIRRKVVLAISTDKSIKGRAPIHNEAFKEISDFISAEVEARRKHPSDDLISHLAEAEIDGDRLSDREVLMTTATFVMAGVESLSSYMSMLALNTIDTGQANVFQGADGQFWDTHRADVATFVKTGDTAFSTSISVPMLCVCSMFMPPPNTFLRLACQVTMARSDSAAPKLPAK
jgi:cytochrome P450